MRLKYKVPVLIFLMFGLVVIFSDIYPNNVEKNKPIPENIVSIKLNQFDNGDGINETRYDKLKSRTFFEKVNFLLSKRKRYIPEVLNNSLFKGVVADDFQVNDDRYAILCHANYLGLEKKSLMDKTLPAVDELTGFIVAVALVRPNKKLSEVKVKSVKKKMKDKAFAKQVSREDIINGAELMKTDLDTHIETVLNAMKEISDDLNL